MRTLAACLPLLEGARPIGAVQAPILRVHTDTRSLQAGDLFVALRGERFDAHAFLVQAREAGAVAAIAERGLSEAGLAGVEVPDSRQALGELARLWRSSHALPLIAVTGSNGKTTVTQMVASILRAAAGEAGALATQGNYNNDIGVPLTLLRLRPEHRYAVIELGMNHPGEIHALAHMASPAVVLVNNAQREHQEFMATVEAVARENASAFVSLPMDGIAVFPADDPYTPLWRDMAAGRKRLTFGDAQAGADVHAQAVATGSGWSLMIHTPRGSIQTSLSVAGMHNVRNALAATACALAAGIGTEAVAQGLAGFQAVQGRTRVWSLNWQGRPLTLVDDSYNANPDSVRAAIDVLAGLPGPRWLALGDMGEVGDQGLAFHQEVLAYALEQGIDRIWVTGPWMTQASPALTVSAQDRLVCWPDLASLQAAVLSQLHQTGSLLVKGSRFMRMERLVEAVVAACPNLPTKEGATHAA